MKIKKRSPSGKYDVSRSGMSRFVGGVEKRLRELRDKYREKGSSEDWSLLKFSILTLIPSRDWKEFERGKDFPIERLIQVCLATKTDPNWILFGDDKGAWQQTRGPWARQRADGVTEIYSKQSKPIRKERANES